MKKSDGKYLAVFSGIEFDNPLPRPVDPVPELDESQLKKVLDEIFSVDPLSGFPKGDFQYYMSANGNPQVKAWLEQYLLKPRMPIGSSVDGMTDDMSAEFSRGADESLSDYQLRITSLYDSAKAEYEKSLVPKIE